MARTRHSGCTGRPSKPRSKLGPDTQGIQGKGTGPKETHCDNPGDSVDMIFQTANNDPKRALDLYRDLHKSALSTQPRFGPSTEHVQQLFQAVYNNPAVTERNLRLQVRLVQQDKFLWSKELEGYLLYLHLGASGLTRTFLRELRELAEMRHSSSSDQSLTWEQALELLKRAQSRRQAGQCKTGTSTDLEWQPTDCKVARAIAEEELGFIQRPIQTTRKRSKRNKSEEATPSQPDGGEEDADEDDVTLQGGHEDAAPLRKDAEQEKESSEGNGSDGEAEMDIEQARGSGATTGSNVCGEHSAEDDLDPAEDGFDQGPNQTFINFDQDFDDSIDQSGLGPGETPKRVSALPNSRILGSPTCSHHSTCTHAHTPAPVAGDNDESYFELPVMVRSPSQSPAFKKPRLLNGKSTPSSSQPKMSDATRLEAACAFLSHFAGTGSVAVTMQSHARAVTISSTAPSTAITTTSTPPLFLALIAPPPDLPTGELDLRWLLAQASNHERTSFTLRTSQILRDPSPPTTAITLDYACTALAAVLGYRRGEGNIQCRQESFPYETVDLHSHTDESFICSLATATCLMTDTELPSHISFFAWEGALAAASEVHVRVSEVRRAVELPELPQLPALEIPDEYYGDLLTVCLEKYSNRLTGCEQQGTILEHYLSQLRLIRECATSSAAYVESVPAQANTERLDQRIAKLEELLALCDSDDDEAGRYQQNLARLREQKAASQGQDRRKRLESLTSWIAMSIQEADIKKSAAERSKKKVHTSLRSAHSVLASMIPRAEV